MWNPCENMWNPCGIHVEICGNMWNPCRNMDSMMVVESMVRLCGIHGIEAFHGEVEWNPHGMWGHSKVLLAGFGGVVFRV